MDKSVIKLLDCLEDIRRKIIACKDKSVMWTSDGKGINIKNISGKAAILFYKEKNLARKGKLDDLAHELESLIVIIKTSKEKLPILQEIFDDFNILSFYMPSAMLNNRETFQVIEFFINRNIASNISGISMAVNLNKLKNLKFETIDTCELISMIKNGQINEFINRDESKLSEKEKAQIEEFKRRFPEFSSNIEEVAKNNYKFKNIIIDNIANITLEDIVDGINILKSLDCSDEVILKIKRHLLSTYEKNLNLSSEKVEDLRLNELYIDMLIPLNVDKDGKIIKDEMYSQNNRLKRIIRSHNEALDITPNTAQETIETKKYLTEKEVRELKKYLGIFYDTYHSKIRMIPNSYELFKVVDCMEKLDEDNMSIRRFLTNLLDFVKEQERKKENEQENTQDNQQEDYVKSKEELVKVASLFIRYKVENKYIYAFIKKYSSKFIKTYDNPIDEYLDRLEEIRFYDESIKSNMDELYAMTLNPDEDNYEIIASMMGEYLDKINQKSDKVSYEYSLAYKLNQV